MIRATSIFFFAYLFCFYMTVNADTYKAAIMQLPGTENHKKLFRAIAEVTDNVFEIKVVPSSRAVNMIEEKLVDVQFPRLKGNNEDYNKTLKYDFASTSISTIVFVLYTNKDRPIDINNLRKINSRGYKIAADGPNVNLFRFTAIFSRGADLSLQMVASGRIDGCIYSQNTGDYALRSLKLTNIRRHYWDKYATTFTLQKGQARGKLDNTLTEAIKKLHASGKLHQIYGEINRRIQIQRLAAVT